MKSDVGTIRLNKVVEVIQVIKELITSITCTTLKITPPLDKGKTLL